MHFEQYLPVYIKLTVIWELHFGQPVDFGDFGEFVGEGRDCDVDWLVGFVVIDGIDSDIVIYLILSYSKEERMNHFFTIYICIKIDFKNSYLFNYI